MFQNVFSQLFHSPFAEISNLALSTVLTFFSNSFSAIGRSVGSIWTYLQTTFQYLYFRVSHWVVPHWWCISAQFAYEADPYLSLHKHSEWVCHLSSIHISCMWHSWILACLMHTQWLWLALLRSSKMPLFPLLFSYVVVPQGLVRQIMYHGDCGMLFPSTVVFCFWLFWYVAGPWCGI